MDLVDLACPLPGVADPLPVTATGDAVTVSGTRSVVQRAYLCALTDPGDVVWDPDYGGGVPGLRGQPVSAVNAGAARLDRQLGEDPRVDRLRITRPLSEGRPDRVNLQVAIQTVDDDRVSITLTA